MRVSPREMQRAMRWKHPPASPNPRAIMRAAPMFQGVRERILPLLDDRDRTRMCRGPSTMNERKT
jgi:hypothetical protein